MLRLPRILLFSLFLMVASLSAAPAKPNYDKHHRTTLFLDKVITEKPNSFILEGHVGLTPKNRKILTDNLVEFGKSKDAELVALVKGIGDWDLEPDMTNSMLHLNLEFSHSHARNLGLVYFNREWYKAHEDWKDESVLFLSAKANEAIQKKLDDLSKNLEAKEFQKAETLELIDELRVYVYRAMSEYVEVYHSEKRKNDKKPDQKDVQKNIGGLLGKMRALKAKAYTKLGFKTILPILWGIDTGTGWHDAVESWVTFDEYKKLGDLPVF